MIRLKEGVSLAGLTTQALLGIKVAEAVYEKYDRVLWITSVNDGKHDETSLHHSGNAFDCRVWHLESWEQVKQIGDEIKAALGSDYDVVLEGRTLDNENAHIHVEYQPRQRTEI